MTVTAGANIAATIIGGMTGTTEGDSTELNRRVEKSALPALLLSANVAAVVPVQLVLTAFLLAPNFALVKYRSAIFEPPAGVVSHGRSGITPQPGNLIAN